MEEMILMRAMCHKIIEDFWYKKELHIHSRNNLKIKAYVQFFKGSNPVNTGV